MKIMNKDFNYGENLHFNEFNGDTEKCSVESSFGILTELTLWDTELERHCRRICSINSKYFFIEVVDGIQSPKPIQFYPQGNFKKFIDEKLSSI